jgi:hypothetical protein
MVSRLHRGEMGRCMGKRRVSGERGTDREMEKETQREGRGRQRWKGERETEKDRDRQTERKMRERDRKTRRRTDRRESGRETEMERDRVRGTEVERVGGGDRREEGDEKGEK